MTPSFWRGLRYAILFSAILYFGLGSIYWWGYSRGKASVEINRAVCMAEILRWGK